MGIEEGAKDVARTAESKPAFEWLARAGFAALGVIHLLVGVLVMTLVFGGNADSSQSGALKALAAFPGGIVLLWALGAVLGCLAVWEVFDGVLARGTARHRWQRRISDWSRAAVYIVFGILTATVALGSRPNADRSAEDASKGLIAVPGGVFLLAAIGAGIAAAGVVFAVIGIRRGFQKKMALPEGVPGRVIRGLGIVGYVAKGTALIVVGVLLLVAAVAVDPDAAGGLDAAMSALLRLPFGPALTAAVGAGFMVYGLFCFLRTRYATLQPPS